MKETDFEINRDAVERYFRAGQTLFCLIPILPFIFPLLIILFGGRSDAPDGVLGLFGVVSMLPLIHYFGFGRWLCSRQAKNLRYRLDGNVLRAEGGVFFLFRKSIPLERITDIALVQGPLLRFFGIWAMKVQTAGSPQAEAILYGVCEAENVRELILSQRQGVYGNK